MIPVGSIGRGDGDRELTVGEIALPLWSCDPYVEDGEPHLSCLAAVEKHTGNARLPTVGSVVDCETPSGEEFVGEVTSLGLEGRDLSIDFRLVEGAETWEGRL